MTNVVAKDKVFLITGGASFIGPGLVEAFLKEDCKHVAFLGINELVGKELEKKLHEAFGNKKSQFIKCDITNEAELDDAFDKVIKKFKYIDVVINNDCVMNDARHIYRKEIELNLMEPQYKRTGVRVITVCFGKTETSLIANTRSFDEETNAEVQEFMDQFACQKAQSAVNGAVEAFRRGDSGSTWIAVLDRPANDITAKIEQAYSNMESTLYEE